jgi:hypothetical protein
MVVIARILESLRKGTISMKLLLKVLMLVLIIASLQLTVASAKAETPWLAEVLSLSPEDEAVVAAREREQRDKETILCAGVAIAFVAFGTILFWYLNAANRARKQSSEQARRQDLMFLVSQPQAPPW